MSLTEDESVYACYNSECTSCYEEYEEEPNQETLEEAANRLATMIHSRSTDAWYLYKDGIIKGIEYQAKRMYSEEDLLSAFEAGMMFIGEDKGSFKEWFEQFKKK
jgi:hypothetical protein